jgi:hypothetical protein
MWAEIAPRRHTKRPPADGIARMRFADQIHRFVIRQQQIHARFEVGAQFRRIFLILNRKDQHMLAVASQL